MLRSAVSTTSYVSATHLPPILPILATGSSSSSSSPVKSVFCDRKRRLSSISNPISNGVGKHATKQEILKHDTSLVHGILSSVSVPSLSQGKDFSSNRTARRYFSSRPETFIEYNNDSIDDVAREGFANITRGSTLTGVALFTGGLAIAPILNPIAFSLGILLTVSQALLFDTVQRALISVNIRRHVTKFKAEVIEWSSSNSTDSSFSDSTKASSNSSSIEKTDSTSSEMKPQKWRVTVESAGLKREFETHIDVGECIKDWKQGDGKDSGMAAGMQAAVNKAHNDADPKNNPPATLGEIQEALKIWYFNEDRKWDMETTIGSVSADSLKNDLYQTRIILGSEITDATKVHNSEQDQGNINKIENFREQQVKWTKEKFSSSKLVSRQYFGSPQEVIERFSRLSHLVGIVFFSLSTAAYFFSGQLEDI